MWLYLLPQCLLRFFGITSISHWRKTLCYRPGSTGLSVFNSSCFLLFHWLITLLWDDVALSATVESSHTSWKLSRSTVSTDHVAECFSCDHATLYPCQLIYNLPLRLQGKCEGVCYDRHPRSRTVDIYGWSFICFSAPLYCWRTI